MRKLIRALRKSRKLIEKGWVQGTYAVDEKGDPVNSEGPFGKCFCMVGAVRHATRSGLRPVDQDLRFALSTALGETLFIERGDDHIPTFNDDPLTKQEDVLGVFDRTIERLSHA